MIQAGQLRRWIVDKPGHTPSAVGTHFMIIEIYKMNPSETRPERRWTCLMEGQVKWFYTAEIEKHSEVVSG